jgi:hypothetical protein
VYPELSEGRPGLLGAVVSRAEAQTMRLAMLYALLDCSRVIEPVHLRAALALWEYAEASARYIFGDALGDPLADELLAALRGNPEGLSRTDIRDQFSRHKRAGAIDAALGRLADLGLVECRPVDTGGRPAQRWYATRADATIAT